MNQDLHSQLVGGRLGGGSEQSVEGGEGQVGYYHLGGDVIS